MQMIAVLEGAGVTADMIVVDPPLLDAIIGMRPKRIVYVSPRSGPLAHDLRLLEDGDYRTIEVQPVDMFPYTGHAECCVPLIRK